MNKQPILWIIVLLFLMNMSHVQARTFYFYASNGAEIKADAERDNNGIVQYTFEVPESIAPKDAFYDFVSSTMNQENFEYIEVRPCPDCVTHQDQSSGPVYEQKKIRSKTDLANILLENIAAATGTRSVNSVFDIATKQNADSSQFQVLIIRDDNKKPVGMCLITNDGTCDPLSNVTATTMPNDGFAFLVSEIDNMDYWKKIRTIEDAIERYVRSIRYQCRITFTGSGKNLVKQIVCFPSY